MRRWEGMSIAPVSYVWCFLCIGVLARHFLQLMHVLFSGHLTSCYVPLRGHSNSFVRAHSHRVPEDHHSRYSDPTTVATVPYVKTNRGSRTNRGRWTTRKHVPLLAAITNSRTRGLHMLSREQFWFVSWWCLCSHYICIPNTLQRIVCGVVFSFIFAFLQFGFRSNNLSGPWTCTQSATVVLVTRTPTMTRQSASMAWLIAPLISTTVRAFFIFKGHLCTWLYFDLSRSVL